LQAKILRFLDRVRVEQRRNRGALGDFFGHGCRKLASGRGRVECRKLARKLGR
jgi:hypothetical protein